jgi:DNA-binding SARP family transcriptional activator
MKLYQGPFARDFDSEWSEDVRRELEAGFVDAAGRLVDELLISGQHAEALTVAQTLLERDPYDEAACKTLLQAALGSGELRAGLRAYERLADALEADLGERPADELARLAADLREQLTRHS